MCNRAVHNSRSFSFFSRIIIWFYNCCLFVCLLAFVIFFYRKRDGILIDRTRLAMLLSRVSRAIEGPNFQVWNPGKHLTRVSLARAIENMMSILSFRLNWTRWSGARQAGAKSKLFFPSKSRGNYKELLWDLWLLIHFSYCLVTHGVCISHPFDGTYTFRQDIFSFSRPIISPRIAKSQAFRFLVTIWN